MKKIIHKIKMYLKDLWLSLNTGEQSLLCAMTGHFLLFIIMIILPYTFLNPNWRSLNMGKSQTIYVDLTKIKVDTKTNLNEKDAKPKASKPVKDELKKEVVKPTPKQVKEKPQEKIVTKKAILEPDNKKDEASSDDNEEVMVVKKPNKVRIIEQPKDIAQDEENKETAENFIKREGIENDYNKPMKELSISIRDAIRVRLRQCWNVDAGAKGIKDMKIEITTSFASDGTVTKVDIMDKMRYEQDPAFRSVAESAKRAVWICSPFSFLPQELYSQWQEINFNFYPYKGSIE